MCVIPFLKYYDSSREIAEWGVACTACFQLRHLDALPHDASQDEVTRYFHRTIQFYAKKEFVSHVTNCLKALTLFKERCVEIFSC